MTKTKKTKTKKKHPVLRAIVKYTFWGLVISGLVGGFIGISYVANVISQTPKITEDFIKKQTGGTTNMYDKNGVLIYSDTEHRRDYISSEDIPRLYKDILLATENKEYYKEKGFSPKGLFNAVKGQLGLGEARGGSTIEQQLIKNLVFSSFEKDRTIDRKVKEIWLATQMDKNFDKEKILEWYINLINMGENSYGANTVAITYYGVSLKDLTGNDPITISKLAIIAGLGQAPSKFNLYDNPDAVTNRRNTVLYSAYVNNVITEQQYEEALKVPVQQDLKERFWRNAEVLERTKEHNAYITSALEEVKRLGYDLSVTPMQINTALDSQANSEVKGLFDTFPNYKSDLEQVASTIIDPQTGFVIAQYGGRNTEAFGLNRATQKTRSSGSSIKPFEDYAPAIEYNGLGSNYILDSSPYTYPGTNFTANNFGGYTYGNVTMAYAVKMSLNTPAIRILNNVVGHNNAKKFLQGIDLDTAEYYGDSTALGLDVSTEQMANANATLARGGVHKPAQYVTSLTFNDGSNRKIEYNGVRAMKESTAYIVLRMMDEVPKQGGTATIAAIPEYQGYAVKTGTVGYDSAITWATSNDASDVWIVGTTKSVSIAIWMGYDSPNEYGNSTDVYGINKQVLFKNLMLKFNQGKDTSAWNRPQTVKGNSVEALTPTDVDASAAYVDKYTEPVVTLTEDTNIHTFNNYTGKLNNIKDKGFEQYVLPDKYKEILEWRTKADKDMLNIYNAYPISPLSAILNQENGYYKSPEE